MQLHKDCRDDTLTSKQWIFYKDDNQDSRLTTSVGQENWSNLSEVFLRIFHDNVEIRTVFKWSGSVSNKNQSGSTLHDHPTVWEKKK